MKRASLWVVIGMSLLLVTGAIAQTSKNPRQNFFGDFGDFDVMATAVNKKTTSTTPEASTFDLVIALSRSINGTQQKTPISIPVRPTDSGPSVNQNVLEPVTPNAFVWGSGDGDPTDRWLNN
jgi:hypothetical protein